MQSNLSKEYISDSSDDDNKITFNFNKMNLINSKLKCDYPKCKFSTSTLEKLQEHKTNHKKKEETSRSGGSSMSKSKFRKGGIGIYAVKLSKGALQGYSSKLTRENRHKALKVLMKKLKKTGLTTRESIVKLIRRLNIIAIYHKNKNPKVSKIYRKDISYLQSLK